MGFAINTYDMRCLKNYEQAENHFNIYPAVRSKRWDKDKRPLRNTRSTHLAVQKTEHLGVPCYDMVLYRTPMIRYFKPNENGERAIWLQNYSSQSSQRFMWANGWYSGQKILDQSNTPCHVIASFEGNLAHQIWGDAFTCKMVFDADMKLIRDRSAHIPGFKRSSTATMRARRKILKQKIDVMLAMLEMGVSQMLSDVNYDLWEGGNINSGTPVFPLLEHAIRGVQMLEKGGNPSDDDMTRLMDYIRFSAKHTIRNTIERRLYTKFHDRSGWHRLTSDAPEPEGMFADLPADVREYAAPTPNEVLKAVSEKVLLLAGLHADARVPMPQFPTKMPRSWFHSGRPEDIADLLGVDLCHKLTNRKGVVY